MVGFVRLVKMKMEMAWRERWLNFFEGERREEMMNQLCSSFPIFFDFIKSNFSKSKC